MMATQRAWQRPALRTDEEFEQHRAVSWLELFFDLVFVVVISRFAHHLASHLDAAGVVTFAVQFLAVFWAWNVFTYYTERFESEGLKRHCQVDGLGCSVAWRWEGSDGVRGCHVVVVPGAPLPGRDHQSLGVCITGSRSACGRSSVMMMARGVLVTYETIHQWCRKFGQAFANGLCRRRPRPGDQWHLDEVFSTIKGKTHDRWRAVDQDGTVLDILVTSHRDATAATRFFRTLLRGVRCVPRVLVTDQLASDGVAHRRLIRSVEHRRSKYLNNRAENSHQPTRQRERAMKKFTSPGGAQRFLSAFSGISPHFRPRRHRLRANTYRREMTSRCTTWNEIVGLPLAS